MKAAVFAVENTNKPLVVFIRGDLQVNEPKLRNAVQANVFPLTDYENVNLCFGFIGAYELDTEGIDVVYDISLQGESNLIGGANKLDYHLKGISVSRDIKPNKFVDVAKVNEGDTCTKCGGKLKLNHGIEVGNIFQLDTKYTASMNMTFTDIDGKQKHPLMGCYGFFEGAVLKGILPFNNLGSCIPHYEVDDAVTLFAGIIKERKFEFLLGMRKLIKPLYEEIRNYKEIQAYHESSYFINRSFKPFILSGINFVNANSEISDKIVDFIIEAHVKGLIRLQRRKILKKL